MIPEINSVEEAEQFYSENSEGTKCRCLVGDQTMIVTKLDDAVTFLTNYQPVVVDGDMAQNAS